MSEDLADSPLPGIEPVAEDEEQSADRTSSETDDSDTAAAQSTREDIFSERVERLRAEVKEEDDNDAGCEPPVDWFEPLEDDEDDFSFDRNDPEEESLAGESESMAGSEKAFKKFYNLHAPRRRRSKRDEGWEEWPVLGEGWKRKEVVRQSGSSIGQKDVYYIGPRGDRVRSRVELLSVLEGQLDLSHFDYKSGTFFDSNRPPVKVRHRMRKKIRERSSSESSFMERGEGADTPDSYHRLTPNLTSKSVNSSQTSHSWNNTEGSQGQGSPHIKTEDKIKLPFPSSSRPLTLPCINGTSGAGDSPLICAKCGISFIGTWYDKQRKKPCCSTCWASKTKEHPMIRFRKWIPCGQCVGCHNTVNCGQCANCKHGLQSPETRRRVCRKRRCICPIRKGSGQVSYGKQKSHSEAPEAFDDNMSLKSEVAESQPSLKNSDTENVSLNIDDDDDDMSTDDDDDWHKKRKRRSCGECKACRCRRDCGTCDFCVDKPKFGGSNKKRQKCRLRQCQRQAMRHLLPFQMGQGDNGPDGPLPGRPKPHYTYSRKSGFKRKKGTFLDVDYSDEDDDSNLQPSNCSSEPQSRSKPSVEVNPSNHSDFDVQNGLSDRVPPISNHNSQLPSKWNPGRSRTVSNHQQPVEEDDDEDDEEEDDEYDDDEEELPMIANVFSFADNPSAGGDVENQLLKLLHSLRSSVLPIMWYAILVEGPQLQLIQCSKQSNMTDTMVLIDPGFCYQVTVQRQPLLPTHPLYDSYPARLTSVTEVVNLLLGLEKYVVCQGLPPRDTWLHRDPIILERASTCDFLVCKTVSICSNCRELQEL